MVGLQIELLLAQYFYLARDLYRVRTTAARDLLMTFQARGSQSTDPLTPFYLDRRNSVSLVSNRTLPLSWDYIPGGDVPDLPGDRLVWKMKVPAAFLITLNRRCPNSS